MSNARTIIAALLVAAASAALASACIGKVGDEKASGTTSGGTCATSENDAIRLALAPTCKACHDTGSNRPFFASLDGFENLLVYNPDLVVPGKPDSSRLVAILSGTNQGTYTQMPLTGKTFAELSAAGSTKITLDAIKQWITALPPPDPARSASNIDSPTTRRLRTKELVYALQRTLGFKEVGATDAAAGQPKVLWVRDPDELGETDYTNIGAIRNWTLLGGGDSLARIKDDPNPSPSMLRTMVEVSLEWCGDAVAKGDQVIFRNASPTDTSGAAPDKIRANIGYLHLRLLGEAATAADVDAYYKGVFLPAEPRGGAVAWTEVCAALVRDPRFLTF